ncbi:MAG: hypothetical protein ABFD04_12000 [Syntrophomonas sp.]
MKNRLKYIALFTCIGLLALTFTNYSKLGSVAQAVQNKIIKGIKATNNEGLNPYTIYDYTTYDNIKELVATSNAIIKGEVINVHSPVVMTFGTIYQENNTEPMKAVFTVSDIQVTESIKGTLQSGDVIQVRQMGGSYKGVEYPTDNPELYSQNMQGVFFLITSDNHPADQINPTQGFVKVINGKVDNQVEDQSYKIHHSQYEASQTSSFKLFENGMDEKELIKLIKESI